MLPEAFDIAGLALELMKEAGETLHDEATMYGNFPSLFMGLVTPDGGLEHYDGLLRVMEKGAEPVLTTLLGLPGETAGTFIIGFLRRDFGAAGIYEMMKAGQLDAVQVTVAAVTITLFIPCIAHFFMMVKERGWKTGLLIASFIFPFALLVGATLNWVLRTFPIIGS